MGARSRVGTLSCAVAGVLVAVGLVDWRVEPTAVAATELLLPGSGGLAMHVVEGDGRLPRVILVDPLRRVMGVYDVADSGEIRLKSVRNLNGDLSMQEFNSGEPSVAHIQKQLQRERE